MASQGSERKLQELSDTEVGTASISSKKGSGRYKGHARTTFKKRAHREEKKQHRKVSSKTDRDEGFEEGAEIEEGGDAATGPAEYGFGEDLGTEQQGDGGRVMHLELRPRHAASEEAAVDTKLLDEYEMSLGDPDEDCPVLAAAKIERLEDRVEQQSKELEGAHAEVQSLEARLVQQDKELGEAHAEIAKLRQAYNSECAGMSVNGSTHTKTVDEANDQNRQLSDSLKLHKIKNKHLQQQLSQKNREISQKNREITDLSNTNYDMTCTIEDLVKPIEQLQLNE